MRPVSEFLASGVGNRFGSAEKAAEAQLSLMLSQATEFGCSASFRAPINKTLLDAYKEIGEKPRLREVVTYDPLQVLPGALQLVSGGRLKVYSRTFRPGEGEGTHTDPHDYVLTYTQTGTAEFTVASEENRHHLLGPHNIVLFNGRLPHEVSAPDNGSRRTITAFAVDL